MSKSVYKKSDLRKLYLLRWISILALGVIASFIIHFIFQLQAARNFSNYVTSEGFWSIVIVSALQGWLIYAICRKFHVKTLSKQPLLDYYEQLKYPSISWLFIFIPLIYIINTGLSNFVDAFINTYRGLNLSIILFSFSSLTWLKENPISSHQQKNKVQITVDDVLNDDEKFERWLIDKDPSDVDLLNRDGYINRIANRIQQEKVGTNEHGRSQVLLGGYGSGKSTIIKLVVEKVEDTKKGQWISSAFSSWGRGDQGHSFIYLLLEQIISDLGKEIEVTSLTSLPKNYLAAAYNIHPWFHVLSILNSAQSPEEVLKSIDQLLEVNDKKLLIVLEDIDRANGAEGAEGVVNDFCGFFDRLKELRHVKFIITIGYGNSNNEIFITLPRIVDAREDLSEANVDFIIKRFFKFCMNHQCTNGKYIFGEKEPYEVWSLSARSSNVTNREQVKIYDELLSILSNPRTLKLVLKRTYESWKILAGEVSFNDLLLFNAYRHTHLNFNQVVDSLEQRNEEQRPDSKIHAHLSGEKQNHENLQGFRESRYKEIIMNEDMSNVLISDTSLFCLLLDAMNNKENSYYELSGLIYSDDEVRDRFFIMLRHVNKFYEGGDDSYREFIINLASSVIEKSDGQVASCHNIISGSIRQIREYNKIELDKEFFMKLFGIGFSMNIIKFIINIKLISPQGFIGDLNEISKPVFNKMFMEFMGKSKESFNCDNYKVYDFLNLRKYTLYKNMFLDSLISKSSISPENCLIMVSLIVYEESMEIVGSERFNDGRNYELGCKDYTRAFENIFTEYESEDDLIIKMLESDAKVLSNSIHWDKIQPVLEIISPSK